MLRRLVAEAVARHVEHDAARRHAPARRPQRIDVVTSGRREDQVGGFQRRGPSALVTGPVYGGAYFRLIAVKA